MSLANSVGGFGGNTQTPILFVSNTVDPVTPILKYSTLLRIHERFLMALSGVKAQFIFNKAKLLTIDAFGVSPTITHRVHCVPQYDLTDSNSSIAHIS